MRYLIIVLSLFLITCGGGGGGSSPTEPENQIVINLASLSGNAQKGPFNNGTAINIAELTSLLSPTGRNFSTQIVDNAGFFSVANVQLESPYVELRANGYYFNEVANEVSSGQLTLYALSDLTNKTSVNVNLLSHLEKNRIATLMAGTAPLIFTQAKNQAQEEVLAIFDYSRAGMPNSELLDITQAGANNAKLLAISAIVQGDLTVGQMSELLANISTDISTDGTLDNTAIQNTLIDNSKNLDLAQIRANLEARYTSLGMTVTIPDFETEVHQFLKPPVSQDINASTNEDVAINITLAGSDPEGEALTYTILEINNATVTLNNNVANYLPDANFNGADTFTYYANDGTSDSNIATVTMTVNAEDDDPNTQNVSATTDEDVAVVVQLAAEEYDGDSYSFAIVDDPTNGSVSLDGTTVTYTPNQDFNGTDTFTFEATDDTGRFMNVGTATITINPINDAPVLVTTSVTASVNEEASVDITITATDVDGDQLTFHWNNNDWSGGSDVEVQGDITINANIFTFAANPNTELSEGVTTIGQFYYLAQDSEYNSDVGLATVTITGVDDLPHADNLNVSVDENSNVFITLSSTDPDGGDNSNIQYEITESSTNGSIVLNGDIVEYNPNQDYFGNDSFKYRVVGDSVEAIVNITINEVIGITKIFTLDNNYDTYVTDVAYNDVNNRYVVTGLLDHKFNNNEDMSSFIAEFNDDLSLNNWEQLSIDLNIGSLSDDFELSLLSNNSYLLWDNNTIFFMNSDHTLNKELYFPDESLDNVNPNGGFYIGSIIEDNGNLIVTAAAGNYSGMFSEYKPLIIKLDMNGNINYYNLFESNNLDTDDYSYEFFGYGRSIKSAEANKYFIAGSSFRKGWQCNNQTSIFEVEDTGTSFQLIGQYNEPNPDCSTSNDAGNLKAVSIAPINSTNGTASDFYVAGTSNNDFIVQWFQVDNNQMTKMGETHSIYVQDFRDKLVEIISDPDNPSEAYLIAASTTAYIYLYKYNAATIEWGGTRNILTGANTDDWLGGIDIINGGIHSGKIIFSGSVTNHDNNTRPGYLMILDRNGE